ncbi:carbohydrate ABC transporter permease [Dictyobacter aurantiacus]|uniref:Sugar ABC transporter permease n=1 Tax=Dictyobacter aurantiacus TaxID=1936993 RepID=A0A401Z804_9CHLR|nr:carbohydrate ABC transporter permease [Dictyobacter aurantiacus]GCE02969.1 sugar ABC transporter permease [Dictyobacter aurantiacus]
MSIALPNIKSSNAARKKPKDDADSGQRTLISPLERQHLGVRIILNLILIILIAISLSFLVPLCWLFIGAIKSAPELLQVPPTLLPRHTDWSTYGAAWSDINFGLYFFNTLVITVIGWFIPMTVNICAAYALSKLRPAFGGTIMVLFLSTMTIPGVVYIIPQYLNIVHLGLVNTWWSLWLPGAFSAFNILILKAFFDSIPDELSDAAVLDGANPLQILYHIILPLSRPVISVITIFSIIGSWQQFFGPYLYIIDAAKWPIGTALYVNLRDTNSLPANVQFAAMAIAVIPPLVFYGIFQKQIIKGINLSGFMNA